MIYADGRKISEWIQNEDKNLHHPCVGLVQGLNIWGKTRELETLQDVMEKMPHVTFYLVGDGAYSEKIIPKLEKFENFIWLKNLGYPEKIMQFLSSIDVFLLLSGLEGLGQSIIEAMIMKKPIIDVSLVSAIIGSEKSTSLILLLTVPKIIRIQERIAIESTNGVAVIIMLILLLRNIHTPNKLGKVLIPSVSINLNSRYAAITMTVKFTK